MPLAEVQSLSGERDISPPSFGAQKFTSGPLMYKCNENVLSLVGVTHSAGGVKVSALRDVKYSVACSGTNDSAPITFQQLPLFALRLLYETCSGPAQASLLTKQRLGVSHSLSLFQPPIKKCKHLKQVIVSHHARKMTREIFLGGFWDLACYLNSRHLSQGYGLNAVRPDSPKG